MKRQRELAHRTSQSARSWTLLRYLWPSPYTLLGALLGLAMIGLGGRCRLVDGIAEISGGVVGHWTGRTQGFSAITFGHVVLGTSPQALAALRRHEQAHVAQYERWGPLFLPAYLVSSAWEALHGRCAYRDNFFERQARALAGET